MKKCPYCGKEYSDGTTTCLIDGELLRDNNLQSKTSDKPAVDTLPNKDVPYLTFPDYRWSARDAWKCIGIIIAFEFALALVLVTAKTHMPGFRIWRESGFGNFCIAFLAYSIGLLTAAYFARTEQLFNFLKGFGLDRKPSEYVWYGIIAALALRFFGHVMFIHGWGNGISNHEMNSFRSTLSFERYFFLAPLVLLAPLFEEPINRGFLYKAFRGSYPISISLFLIIAWTALKHWNQYSHSWVAALDLSMLTIVQCYLREKSDSLWDCILCHFAFNASSLLLLQR